MLQYSKPLSRIATKPLINKAFSLNEFGRYFKFQDEDSYVRVFTKNPEESQNSDFDLGDQTATEPSNRQRLVFRYDGPAFLRNVFKSSVDYDLQNLFNSFLVTGLLSTGRRISTHEVSHPGIRQGIDIAHEEDRGSNGWQLSFGAVANSFIGFFNDCDAFPGNAGIVSLQHSKLHTPLFSHGVYKGSGKNKSVKTSQRIMGSVYKRFEAFSKTLDTPNLSEESNQFPRAAHDASSKFNICVFSISGNENSTSYASGGMSQSIPVSMPIRNKNGLYAILSFPSLDDDTGSPAFNSYSGNPKLALLFRHLSKSLVIRLGDSINASCSDYAAMFSEIINWSGANFRNRGTGLDYVGPLQSGNQSQVSDYNTIGPLVHMIVPDSSYKRILECAKTRRVDGLSSSYKNDIACHQEWMNLSVDGVNIFHQQQILNMQSGYNTRPGHQHVRLAGAWADVSGPVLYGWSEVQLSRHHNAQVAHSHSNTILPFHGIEPWFTYGAHIPSAVSPGDMAGSLYINPSPHSSCFNFFSQGPVNTQKLFCSKERTALCDFEFTRDNSEIGRGKIFVDCDNVAYCPLSGEPLRVVTFLKTNNRDHYYGRSLAGKLL